MSTKLLQLDATADADGSRTRAITSAFAFAWADASSGRVVVQRDLHRDALPIYRT